MEKRIHISLSPAATEALDRRAEPVRSHGGTRTTGRENLSGPASAMIERYDYLVASGVRLLVGRGKLNDKPVFTAAHFCAAADCLNSTAVLPDTLNYIGDEIAEAIRLDGLGEKWELPEGAAEVFEGLGALELLALADLKERFWRGVTRGDTATPREFWESVSKVEL